MHANLQQTYFWPQMAADFTSAVQDYVHCINNRIFLRKRASPLKLFLLFEALKTVANDIIGPLPKSQRGFRYIVVIADQLTKLFQVVPVRHTSYLNFGQAFLEHWVYRYENPKTLLADDEKIPCKIFQGVYQLLQVSDVFTFTYHQQTNR